ncbi:MAG: nitroreductase family protein [Propionibacteriaceae bacterium]|jgi:nitroreductase|nr:nitroreductase family protein [Propionibacteriaceae bacterium]
MNATLETIQRRYACRSFQDTPVPDDLLGAVVEAGLHAPSAVNRQPWRLIVISDKAVIDELDAAGVARLSQFDPAGYQRILDRGGRLLYNCPALVLVLVERMESFVKAELDAGIVVSHLLLAATAVGLSSCPCALIGAALTGPEGEVWRRRLDVPDDFDFALAILLGYATGAGSAPHAVDWSKVSKLTA